MKHPTTSDETELSVLLGIGCLEVNPRAQREMLRYLEGLLAANTTINLTSITDLRAGLRMHLVDSLLALPEIHDAPSGVMIDLGSGGGFPGVPLALATGRPAILLDSVRKKGTAVAGILGQVVSRQDIVVASERAEDHARTHAREYAVVVARAVAPLASLLELASPLLVRGGLFVALKGAPGPGEIADCEKVASLVGFGRLSSREVALPGGRERRTIVSAVKTRESTVALPRRNGLAQKSPFAQ